MVAFKHFDVRQQDRVTVLALRDPRLAETLLITELHDELLEFVETRQPKRLVVDFSTVTFCTTAVINGLLRIKKRLLPSGGHLALCGMQPKVREAWRVLNLDGTVFQICDTPEEAIALVQA